MFSTVFSRYGVAIIMHIVDAFLVAREITSREKWVTGCEGGREGGGGGR